MSPPLPTTAAPHLRLTAPAAAEAGDAETLIAGSSREGERLADADLTGRDLTGSTFLDCELAGLTLDDAQLRGSRFVETLLVAPFAPSLLAARTTWRDCRIENPRWGSAELFDAELGSVHLRGGKIDYLNLRGSRLTDVLIEDCALTELDLGGFRGTRVAFRNCRIETLDVTRATCSAVDLRGSSFSRVVGLDGLRGATIDDEQLVLLSSAFAAQLGVRVE